MPWLVGRAERQRMEQGVMSGWGAGRGPWHAGGTAGSGSPGDFFCGLIDVSLVWNQASKEQANFFTSKVQIYTLKVVWQSSECRGVGMEIRREQGRVKGSTCEHWRQEMWMIWRAKSVWLGPISWVPAELQSRRSNAGFTGQNNAKLGIDSRAGFTAFTLLPWNKGFRDNSVLVFSLPGGCWWF